MTTCSAACSLATEERPSPGTGSPAPRPGPAPPPLHTTAPGTSCRLCGTHGSRIWLSPCALLPNTPAPS